ncbi:hypothetical protein V498_00778 [Pseudogymnoascus sp. VKM F-4517 (FW-2822)]|nr:hypothetical protein V498_00778 [Pseudogymnoascus sp. VKM F-4517 (FW-2822)]
MPVSSVVTRVVTRVPRPRTPRLISAPGSTAVTDHNARLFRGYSSSNQSPPTTTLTIRAKPTEGHRYPVTSVAASGSSTLDHMTNRINRRSIIL